MTEEKLNNKPDNVIFCGKKPCMVYVNAVQLSLGMYDTVKIQARGKSISTAVDVEEVVKRFMPSITVESVKLSSEEFFAKDRETQKVTDRKLRVSAIEITLKK